jgi:hypothetical protein
MLRSGFALASCFALVLPGCSSTAGCEATGEDISHIIEVAEAELVPLLKENGWIDIEDCRRLCENDAILTCRPEEGFTDAGGDPRQVRCVVQVKSYCEGRRHAVNRSRAWGKGPSPSAAWLARAAHDEAGSVAAFLALRTELARLGAPHGLLRRTLRAAAEEVTHARSLGRLARARGGRSVPLSFARSGSRRSAPRIARENAIEGCVNETFAALMAARQAAHARDRDVRRAFAAIANDELAHAELAWDIHRFLGEQLDERGRRSVRKAMRAASERLIETVGEPSLSQRARLDLGLPDPAEAVSLSRGLAAHLWT